MKLIPAMDLIDGNCVRLKQGDFNQVTQYSTDPITVAQMFFSQGAEALHIVDLDGARDPGKRQLDLIKQVISETSLNIQVGGGIRTKQQICELLEVGISRVVIGSAAINDPGFANQCLTLFGPEQLVFALDVKFDNQGCPKLVTSGWQSESSKDLWQLLDSLIMPCRVLCTDISRDGMLQGPNFDLYKTCIERFPDFSWQGSGGVSSINDLKQLKTIGMSSVILGKSLYERKINLKEALCLQSE